MLRSTASSAGSLLRCLASSSSSASTSAAASQASTSLAAARSAFQPPRTRTSVQRLPLSASFSSFAPLRQADGNSSGSSTTTSPPQAESSSPSSSSSQQQQQPSISQNRGRGSGITNQQVDAESWSNLLSSIDPSGGAMNSYRDSAPKRYGSVAEQQDAIWARRSIIGSPPVTPLTGRTVNVKKGDVGQAFNAVNGILARNGVMRERRLRTRYEKPNQERRRKASERHRRRFADLVRQKIRLVMEIKNRGG